MSRNKIIFLVVSSIIIVGAMFYIISTFFTDTPPARAAMITKKETKTISAEMSVLQKDELLHSRLLQLQALDDKYAVMVANIKTPVATADSLDQLIMDTENKFKLLIDSIEAAGNVNIDGVHGNMQENITQSFRKALDQRRMLHLSYQFKDFNTADATTDEKEVKLDGLKAELYKKDSKIIELEGRLKAAYPNYPKNYDLAKNIKKGMEPAGAPALLEMSEKLRKKEIALNEMELRYNSLSNLYAKKIEIDSKPALKDPSTTVAPPEKMADLEAALRLAQVDCNLTRADGRAIIYSSKQRKGLLEESLKILNTLSSSGNNSIQKQVKDKMNELNHIASMIRE